MIYDEYVQDIFEECSKITGHLGVKLRLVQGGPHGLHGIAFDGLECSPVVWIQSEKDANPISVLTALIEGVPAMRQFKNLQARMPKLIKNNSVFAIQNESDGRGAAICKKVLDLQLIWRAIIEKDSRGYIASSIVTENALGLIDGTPAVRMKESDYCIQQMNDLLFDETHDLVFMGEGIPVSLVITNHDRLYGASAIVCDPILQKAAEMLGMTSLIVIPSSIHEIIVLTDLGASTDELDAMVQSVNRETLESRDVLSDHVYYYNAEDHELSYERQSVNLLDFYSEIS